MLAVLRKLNNTAVCAKEDGFFLLKIGVTHEYLFYLKFFVLVVLLDTANIGCEMISWSVSGWS